MRYLLLFLLPSVLFSATYTVTSSADTDTPGTLRHAMIQANLNPGSTITIATSVTSPIILTSDLPPVQVNMTINGHSGSKIDGATTYQPFTALGGILNLNTLHIQNSKSKGGDGGKSGGGGGLGAGGGIFAAPGVVVNSNHVTFSSCTAVGGAGGAGGATPNFAGGGGGGGFSGAKGGDGGIGANGGGGGGGGGYGKGLGGTGGTSVANTVGGGGGGGGGVNFSGGDGSAGVAAVSGGGGGGGASDAEAGFSSTSVNGGQGGNGSTGSGGAGGTASPNAPNGITPGTGNGGGGGGAGETTTTLAGHGGNSSTGAGGGGGGDSNQRSGSYGGSSTGALGGGGGGGAGQSSVPGAPESGGNGGSGSKLGGGGGGGTGNPTGTTNVFQDGGSGGYGGGGGGGGMLTGFVPLATTPPSGSGGKGGFGAGGGASSNTDGGFGTPPTAGTSAFGGGTGGTGASTDNFAGGGGGGAALGGTLFIGQGSTLNINNAFSMSGSSATAGAGGTAGGVGATNGGAGVARGQDIFIASTGTLSFTGTTVTISSEIDSNLGVNTPPDNVTTGGVIVNAGSHVTFNNSGNSYTGSTTINNGGELIILADGALGAAANVVNFTGGGILHLADGITSARTFNLGTGGGVIETNVASTSNITGLVQGTGSLTKTGQGNLQLSNAGNTYSGGTIMKAGNLQVKVDGNLGNTSGGLTFNGGALEILSGAAFTTNRSVNMLSNGSIITDAGSGTSIFNGLISGSGTLTKDGPAILRLTNAGNTYSGGTIIKNGTLQISTDGNLGASSGRITFTGGTLELQGNVTSSRPVTLSTNGTIFADTGTTSLFSGLFSGPGELIKDGPGTLQLGNASNTYSGGTLLKNGILQITSDGNLGLSTSTLTFNGGKLEILPGAHVVSNRPVNLLTSGTIITDVGSGISIFNGPITGTGPLVKDGGDTLRITGNNSYTGGTTVLHGVLEILNDGNLGNSAGAVNLSNGAELAVIAPGNLVTNRTFNLSGGGQIRTDAGTGINVITGLIQGTGPLTKLGPGILRLTNTSNSYTNGTVINGGILQVLTNSVLGNVSGGITFGGGALEIIAPGFTSARAITLNGSGTIITDDGTGVSTLTGQITGSGPLIKSGSATLFLANNTSTYTGGTEIDQGILQINNDGALGAPIGPIIFGGDGSGTLELLAAVNSSRNILLNAQGTIQTDAVGPSIFSGVISGGGPLVKAGGSTTILSLTGTNTYTGGTIVAGGILEIQNDANLGAPNGFLELGPGTTLDVVASGNWVSNREIILSSPFAIIQTDGPAVLNGFIVGPGALFKEGNSSLTLLGENSYAGGTAIAAGTVAVMNNGNLGLPTSFVAIGNATLEFLPGSSFVTNRELILAGNSVLQTDSGSGTTLWAGPITGSGTLIKTGPDILELTGTNTYSGGTNINAGTLKIHADVNLGDVLGNVTFGGGNLELANSIDFGSRNFILNGSGTITTDGFTLSTISTPITGTGPLIKEGSGTLVLTANNSFTNGAQVNAGTLEVDGSIPNTITVNSGGTLTGIGNVGILDIFGTLNPGNGARPAGALSAAAVTFESGSIFDVTISGNTSNQLLVAGPVTIDPNATIDVNPTTATQEFYTVISASSVNGQFAKVVNLFPRYVVKIEYPGTQVIVDITSGIPFPDIIPSGNGHAIAECFEALNPNTPDMTAILNVFNTLTFPQMVSAFQQLSPSFYNGLYFAEESAAVRVREIFTSHTYRHYFLCRDELVQTQPIRLWTDFYSSRGIQNNKESTSNFIGYNDLFTGFATGADYLMGQDASCTVGFAYTRSLVKWTNYNARAGINSYNVTADMVWIPKPYLLDASLGFTYNHASAIRLIDIAPSAVSESTAPPINRAIRGKANGVMLTGHLGGSYDQHYMNVRCTELYVRPFLNLDYYALFQDGIKETGGGSLDLNIRSQYSDLLRPEIGLSFCSVSSLTCNLLLNADLTLSYVHEARFAGRIQRSSFVPNSHCFFDVVGLFPDRNLLAVGALLSLYTTGCFNANLGYKGFFGSQYVENSGTFEIQVYW